MRISGCWRMVLVGCLLFCGRRMVAQDVKVLVLDALNGTPQGNVRVDYFCAGLPLNSGHKQTTTNDEGVATISTSCSDQQKIEISVFPPNKKEQCGGDAGMTFNDVATAGFISKPDSAGGIWCPAKVSRKLKAVRGQEILFVKKPTWYQSHFAG